MKKVLVVSAPPTHPTTAGNRSRMLELCDAMSQQGHEVHFAWIPHDGDGPDAMPEHFHRRFHALHAKPVEGRRGLALQLNRIQRALGLSSAHRWGLDDWYDPAISDQLRELQAIHRFDVVLVAYVFYSRAFEAFGPEVLKVLETHDRFADRHMAYLRSGMQPEWFSTSVRQEARGFARADVVVAIQESEATLFRKDCRRSVRVETIHPFHSCSRQVTLSSEPSAIVVGSANPLNIEGVDYLLDEVVPMVVAEVPHFRLVLAGGLSDRYRGREHVLALGRVNDLGDAYGMARVAVNPVRGGTGFCIKSLEALAFGMPLVATDSGLRGMDSLRGAFVSRVPDRSPVELAQALLGRLKDPDARSSGDAAFVAATKWSEAQRSKLREILELPPRADAATRGGR